MATTTTSALAGTTCMELALEGERLCKTGDLKNGVKFLEEAIRVGTNDDRTLSAIYSQLGNAYFYMEDYLKALEYHKQDVTLVHGIGDESGEAKACGNLGNTFKMLGKFDEAAIYCKRYLEISRKLNDEVGEGRALYNLGNVYHTQGKRMIGASEQEPDELSNDIKSSLQRAIEYYESNLKVVTKLKDYTSMGRAYGNLGNTHYLLGNFEQAVESHVKRLELAKQTNDKSAERRAHLNLGNANVFLGNFPEAIENYSATLKLAQELDDKYTEAHSCYSLANTYTFLRDYKSAVTYHLRYLDMIKEFDDKLGEGRACWSLVNIYQMVNDPESALVYAKKHHKIAEVLDDQAGLVSAKLNIEELEEVIQQKQAAQSVTSSLQNTASVSHRHGHHNQQQQTHASKIVNNNETSKTTGASKKSIPDSLNIFRLTPDKRLEQEQRRFKKQLNSNLAGDIDGLAARRKTRGDRDRAIRSLSNERLFDMIAHFQSGRIDDQRCEISNKSSIKPNGEVKTVDDKENFDASPRRTTRSSQPSISTNPISAVSVAASAIKATYRKASLAAYPTSIMPSIQSQRRPTVTPENQERLFDLIAGAQCKRMDEQRASLPTLTLANGILKNPSGGIMSRGRTIDQSGSTRPENPSSSNYVADGSDKPKSSSKALPSSDAIQSSTQQPRHHKLSKNFSTVDSGNNGHDDKFLDSLMKYQSTRFNDQRSEFPNLLRDDSHLEKRDKNQTDNFFNLIVRFQSDRIDDQRSAPPPSRT